eukprot:2822015-Pyramimonas_sp.AAC.1
MDPGHRLPVNTVRLWLTAWQSEPRLHAGIARAWPTVVAKLTAMPAQMRSRHVRGPLSALVTYLLQYRWDPVSPSEWGTRPAGELDREAFIFNQLGPSDDISPLVDEFDKTIRAHQWASAARHF